MAKIRLYRFWCWLWIGHTESNGASCWKCTRCKKTVYQSK